MSHLVHLAQTVRYTQSVLIERVATPEVSADWSIAQKSSSSSSHGYAWVCKKCAKYHHIFAHLNAYPRNFMCVYNNGNHC